ncbi:MAG TPA: polyhydroxyalkanoate synthesis regulator DNA-binding domain-containing protein [Polyangia bacterium]|nr:polyhydroxyalkanoate synthesis regulator DNA-binding domain-containing protein [Polyangia bacterium]
MTKSTKSGRVSKTATPKRRRGRPTRQETKQREEAYAQFEGERVVHRYGNRRFYDLQSRRAVTLDEIETMVRNGEDVRVLDVDSNNEDITRRVLTQIILEAKTHNNLEMLPVEFLRKLISTQDEKAATWLDGYLKAGAALLDRSVREGMELSTAYHKQLSEIMQGAMPRSWGVPPKRPEASATASRSEIEELRRRLDELAKDAAAKNR